MPFKRNARVRASSAARREHFSRCICQIHFRCALCLDWLTDTCVCFFVYLQKLLILIDCCVMRCVLPRRTFRGNTSTRERPLHMQPDDRQTGSEVNVLQLSRAECSLSHSHSLSSAQLSSAQFCWALLSSALIGHTTDWPGVMPSFS